MSMSVGQEGQEDETPMSEINTTPLVDVMLVLLIIFLITIPVVNETQKHVLPKAANIETVSKPENVVLVVTSEGEYYEGSRKFDGPTALKEYIKTKAVLVPQPEVHVRADKEVRYEAVGRAIVAVQQGGIQKVAFITDKPPRG
jgi:biopolymer transport protein ExbD